MSFTLVTEGSFQSERVALYTPLSGMTANEQAFLANILDQLNETEERAGLNATNFLYRGTIEDVKNHAVSKPINDRWH